MYKIKNVLSWKFIGLSIGLVVAFISFAPFHAFALSVSPVRFQISGDPGATLQEKMNLRNETANPETYYPINFWSP